MNRRAQPWLGTLVDIATDASQAAISAAFAEVALVHRLMSFHDRASDVSRLNRAGEGELVAVHAHTWKVLRLAEQLAAASQGLFNPACASLLVEWGSLPSPAGDMPPLQQLKSAFICEDGDTVRKLQPAWIDLGGIAKGYAVDVAVEALQRAGAVEGCVNAGGDVRVFGDCDWPIAMRDPRAPQRMHSQVRLCDEALATSANYFSPRSLVDGRDGTPMTAPRSISVRAPRCAVADALTKVVMASGDAVHPALTQWRATAFII
jgi:thiamine biosynthesis lipoprotein